MAWWTISHPRDDHHDDTPPTAEQRAVGRYARATIRSTQRAAEKAYLHAANLEMLTGPTGRVDPDIAAGAAALRAIGADLAASSVLLAEMLEP